jgi:hypothetical protein
MTDLRFEHIARTAARLEKHASYRALPMDQRHRLLNLAASGELHIEGDALLAAIEQLKENNS